MYTCGGEVPEFVTVIWFCFTHWNVFRLEHFGKSSRNLVLKNLDEMIEPTSVATLQWLVCAEYFSSRTFLWFNYVTLFLKYSAASSELSLCDYDTFLMNEEMREGKYHGNTESL